MLLRAASGTVALTGIIVQFGRPRDAQMTKPIARDSIYRRRRFDAEVIELRTHDAFEATRKGIANDPIRKIRPLETCD